MEEYSEAQSYLISAAEELEEFLISGANTWQVAGSNNFPPLTPGNVLFAMKQLAGFNDAAGEVDRVKKALDHINHIRIKWESNWKKRVKQEIPQRLRLWSNYLDDYFQSQNQEHREFCWSVRWRVILALLMDEIEDLDQELLVQLNVLDEVLQARIAPGPFIWDERLKAVFDPDHFWFLYLKIS